MADALHYMCMSWKEGRAQTEMPFPRFLAVCVGVQHGGWCIGATMAFSRCVYIFFASTNACRVWPGTVLDHAIIYVRLQMALCVATQ